MITLFGEAGGVILHGILAMVAAALIGGIVGSVVGWISGSIFWWVIIFSISGAGAMLLILVFLVLYTRRMGWQ